MQLVALASRMIRVLRLRKKHHSLYNSFEKARAGGSRNQYVLGAVVSL
jgi:hypothetical protein